MRPSPSKQNTSEIEITATDEATDHNVVEIRAEQYQSIYDVVVCPDQAVYPPAYLRRWLKHIGPDLAWMYVAFRQAAYTAGVRRGSTSHRFTGKAIAALSGITERTFWNRVGNENTWKKLDGLVNLIATGKEWDTTSSTPKQLPRRYIVAMTLPLTPADTASLRGWLIQSVETFGGPEAALRAAIAAPLERLIPQDAEADENQKPMTVRHLVNELFGDQLDARLIESLASALQNHIMVPGDLIKITLFFLRNILPHLGAGPAWILTILRDLGFDDDNQPRNWVTVKGGYAEVAGWLGMSRPMTIWEWLHGKKDNAFREPVLRIYIRENHKNEKELDFDAQPRTFEFLFEDIPAGLVEAALTGANIQETLAQKKPGHATFSLGFTQFSEDGHALFSHAVTRFSEDIHALFSHAVTQLSQDSHATFTVKALNSGSLTLNPSTSNKDKAPENKQTGLADIDENSDSRGIPKETAAAVDSDFWKLDELFKINNVNSKVQQKLRVGKATPQSFVAHLLYAFSRQCVSIQHPLNFALNELQSKPITGPDEKFITLARLPKTVLVALLSGEAVDHPLASTWRKLMGSEGGKTPRYRELLPILLGDAAPTSEELRERKSLAKAGAEPEHVGIPNPFPRPASLPPSQPKPQRRK